MKKILTLVIALVSTSMTFGQMMKDIPVERRFHAMSENGKYMITNDQQGYVGIYNTETDEFDEYYDGITNYQAGMGNMVTDNGYMVGAVDGMPSVLDIKNKKWIPLGLKEGDLQSSSMANGITPSHKYIVGIVGMKGIPYGKLKYKPVLWTLNDDGTYGEYEELPYPEKDFSGVTPMYILANCISEDGTVIAAQLMRQDNECLPMVYRKAEDGTWTYEVYDKGLCEEGLEFPEFPTEEPAVPSYYDYMSQEEANAYKQDSIEYKDSLRAYNLGESTEMPTYYPDPKYYMTEDNLNQYNEAWNNYVAISDEYSKQLMNFRNFYYEHVTPNFYGQNHVWLSTNGKYYATTCAKGWSGTVGDAALFTVDETLKAHDYEDGLYGHCVTNDGDFFVSDIGTAYVYPANSTEKITLIDWLKSKGETEAAEWLSDRETGTAICSGDGRVISGFYGAPGSYRSWIIRLDYIPTGITDVNTAENTGNVKVYDLQGCFIKEAPAANATDGLAKGIYIINNKKVIVK